MAEYRVTIKKSAARELDDISKKDLKKLVKRMEAIGNGPHATGAMRFSRRGLYRIRQGTYRLAYHLDEVKRVADIFKVGRRQELSAS